MRRYNPKDIEPKWQQRWAESKLYEASDDGIKPKKYILEYFPYPSGAAMHVGHVRNYTIGDAMARHARMNGYNVLHPMGWDAFGLPAENFAIKTGISPKEAIVQNTGRFKQQLTQMGFGYDWSREFASSDPNYYKWTQWFFLLLHKRGLAYRKESLQWWCPVDKTVLANEQVENGVCWRCGSHVEKKALKQWFFKITDYADRLAEDLNEVDWTDSIKSMQRNWIGRSKGMVFTAPVKDTDLQIETFSAHFEAFRADTFVVIAPDHPFLKQLVAGTPDEREVLDFAADMVKRRDLQGYADEEHVEGIFTGRYIIDPVGNGDLPIWVASYALSHYGTGIVKCSAHDERDFRFAKKYDIPLKTVLLPQDTVEAEKVRNLEYCFSDMKNGILTEPEVFSGQRAGDLRESIITYLEDNQLATTHVTYRIRDWLISRQRYWGAPIPMIHCNACGTVPVPEDQLPVTLPDLTSFEPSGDGRSPLARIPEFVQTTCPNCSGQAERETDTMDGFACSSWYFLRFADPHNNEKPFDPEKIKQWLPVDDYIGGAEHAVMHLLYARMWTKVMQDEGLIDFGEPFKTLRNHGMILAPDGAKMSKSKGNTIEPDGLIEQGYGADAIRIMELFIGPWNQPANWSVEGMGGSFRFLQRVWALAQDLDKAGKQDGRRNPNAESITAGSTIATPSDEATPKAPDQASLHNDDDIELKRVMHAAIQRVTKDLNEMGFNTAIAALMETVNSLYKLKEMLPMTDHQESWRWAITTLLQLLAPFAPHITEELWEQLGEKASIHTSSWPGYDERYLQRDTLTIVVQVNGKLRAQLEVATDSTQEQVIELALDNAKVQEHIGSKEVRKTIYVPGKLVNFVVV